jgi:YD repeat-containing protein
MKHTIFFLAVLCAGIQSYGQTTVSFNYDDSGNRTSRTTIGMKSTAGNTDASTSQESFSAQVGEHSILIYPNPVEMELTIEIQGLEENEAAKISVFDQNGRLVLTQENIVSSNKVNLSDLARGTYFMIISLGSTDKKWTIVKE